MNEHWSLGWLIGMPLWVVVSTVVGLFAVSALFWADDEKGPIFLGAASVWGIVFFSGLGMLWPLQSQYHKWIPHSGVVAEANSRLVPSGDKSMEQKIVVRFAGDDQEYGCLDTRCALAKKGDHLDLSCIREWEWAATDGYNCKFVKRVPA